jgi:riboflavin kinase/FMN adenylyltransferase
VWVTSSLETALTPTAVALGNFDGVHRGHQQVVQPILGKGQESCELSVLSSETQNSVKAGHLSISIEAETFPKNSSLQAQNSSQPEADHLMSDSEHTYPTVVTFNPHPQEFFTGKMRTLLTPPDEKVQQLRSLGVEQLVLLPFDRELASLSPHQFVEKILVQHLRARIVSVGQDFCFGSGRSGTSADLQAIAAAYGIDVHIVQLQTCQGERISSSFIRQALLQGDIPQANRLLGRPYTLTGTVVQGQQLGRTLGFPTANLQLPPEKFLPQQGVYCVRVWCSNQASANSPLSGVMNIGRRPTVDGTCSTVEVHLLDWSGDLYGQTLTVSVEQFLRPEQKFASLDALKAQIQADARAARAFLSK